MKTKHIPAFIMLFAGFITCVMSIYNKIGLFTMLKTLLIVMICFGIIGNIIKVLLDRTINKEFARIAEEQEAQEEVTNKNKDVSLEDDLEDENEEF